MVKVVSWNIGKREKPWRELVQMASDGAADVALLQEAGSPPGDVVDRIEYVDGVFWNRHLYDRWPLVVKLSDRITVEPYRQVPPTSDLGEEALGVSGIGTIAAARVTPRDNEEEAFVAVSMYARWLRPHPSTKSRWGVGYSDASAHRILSDLSAFIGHADPTTHRILAAGDLTCSMGRPGRGCRCQHGTARCGIGCRRSGWSSWVRRRRTGGARHRGQTTCRRTPRTCRRTTGLGPGRKPRSINWTTRSRRAGSTRRCPVRAMNDIEEWGPSDHCRLMIEVKDNAELPYLKNPGLPDLFSRRAAWR